MDEIKETKSSGKCFSFVSFNERRNHRRSNTSHLLVCPNGLLTNVVVKRALAAAQCVFIIDDRTQAMPIQSVVNVEAISSSTCIISTAPAADVLTPSLIRTAAFILLRSRHSLTRSYGVLTIITIRLFLRSSFQPYTISVFGYGFSMRIGRHYIFLIFFYSNTLLYSLSLFYTNVLCTTDRL
uniref:Uncharacterized protein n=1 Tax=Rhodnius prolixus TaxID=13249 RepID=T1IE69_RHOPR